MEGFLDIRLPAWLRRLITRLIAIVPAVIVTALYGEHGAGALLILSQVILSLQLSFAVVPLVQFTGHRAKMGSFVNGPALKVAAWAVAVVIMGLNIWLLIGTFREWLATSLKLSEDRSTDALPKLLHPVLERFQGVQCRVRHLLK